MRPRDPRFRIIYYVCEGGVRHHAEDEGFGTLDRIFINRPSGCRWVVAETEQKQFIVIDVFDLRWEGEAGQRQYHIGEHWVFPTIDAALMTAHMQ